MRACKGSLESDLELRALRAYICRQEQRPIDAFKTFRELSEEVKHADSFTITKDDPFIGLGILFILGSLVRHGRLPPEISH